MGPVRLDLGQSVSVWRFGINLLTGEDRRFNVAPRPPPGALSGRSEGPKERDVDVQGVMQGAGPLRLRAPARWRDRGRWAMNRSIMAAAVLALAVAVGAPRARGGPLDPGAFTPLG